MITGLIHRLPNVSEGDHDTYKLDAIIPVDEARTLPAKRWCMDVSISRHDRMPWQTSRQTTRTLLVTAATEFQARLIESGSVAVVDFTEAIRMCVALIPPESFDETVVDGFNERRAKDRRE